MKTNAAGAFGALAMTLFVFTACQKSNEVSTETSTTAQSTIAVPASLSGTSAANGTSGTSDSVYLLQPCRRGERRDTVSQAALPASIFTYLNSNYSGATFTKAFALKDQAASVTGYVVVIYFNDKPIGLQFDSAGTFVKVLEQREKGDLDGPGHHRGGRFENRDGLQHDTLALSALPAAVSAYFASNYASDTLVKAFYNRDSSILVLSKNNGVYATVFKADGAFMKRELLPSKQGSCQSIELAALPSVAANYLSQTYPNYVFEKAFSIAQNGTLKGYVVVIDANNTKYAVEFDASGNFVRAKTIR